MNVTGYSLIDGMSGAMDTLGSQHNGAGGLSVCCVVFAWSLLSMHNNNNNDDDDISINCLSTENYREVGLVLQRSCLVLSVLCIPILLVWSCVYDIYR